jgi:phospholipase A2
VILAFDSSADIESVPWFEKTGKFSLAVGCGVVMEAVRLCALRPRSNKLICIKIDDYVKRRGIERWPPISKKRAEQLAKQEGGPPRKMTHVEIFHGIIADDRDADHVVPVNKKGPEGSNSPVKPVAPLRKSDTQPITLIYFPLIPNQDYHEFNPSTEAFCSTFNFEVKEDQVELLAGLGEQNFRKGLVDVKKVLKETWLRKKQERLEREKLEKKNRKNSTVAAAVTTSLGTSPEKPGASK